MFLRNGCRGIRLLTTQSWSKTTWDPVLSLQLNNPSLVLLEKCSSRSQFKEILAQIMRVNLIRDTFPMSRLILFSAITFPENIDMARLLFHHFTPNPNVFVYNSMISSVSISKNERFDLYSSMLGNHVWPDRQTFLYLMKALKCLSEVKQIHCHVIVTGWLYFCNYLRNSLVKLYMELGGLGSANKMFVEMREPDTASYNIMIVGYAKKGFGLEALELYYKMIGNGLEPDDYTMLSLLVCCGQLGDVRLGKSVHGWIERRRSSANLILSNALLDMYLKCEESGLARRVFDKMSKKETVSWNTMVAGFTKLGNMEAAMAIFRQMPQRDLVTWNSLISGYSQKDGHQMTMRELFHEMVVAENVIPDHVTMVSLISGAAGAGELYQGRWIHGLVVRMELKVDAFLGSALIDMYYKCGSIDWAFTVFNTVSEKDVTLWTTMITGFAFHGNSQQALQLFQEMQEDGIMPNKVTCLSILTACTHRGLVEQGLLIFNTMKEKFGIDPEIEHYGSLVDLLCRAGRLQEAKDILQKEMPRRPSQSIWGSILSACREKGDIETAEMALTELLKLEPEREGGYVLLSNIYAAVGRWRHSDKVREVMENSGVKKTAGYSSIVGEGGVHHSFVAAEKQNHPRWLEVKGMIQLLHYEMKLEFDLSLQWRLLSHSSKNDS
ncbi:PREDICTED: pentatricopeptide repeat-containing protein At3g04750, mitochondrial [Tarenaya hassleriana]|uniref:pentatricopeptide repeat-containing protein At3g04750, mitochondrial n=1 Tax=Tarenaya hassleriana TaxID=28532 RepID=UPI00053C78AA|nr:PREDICTED: pentatricopeptide repeat-containing protein At3g04750, mitochondrial [Tarenaya hassleriana]